MSNSILPQGSSKPNRMRVVLPDDSGLVQLPGNAVTTTRKRRKTNAKINKIAATNKMGEWRNG